MNWCTDAKNKHVSHAKVQKTQEQIERCLNPVEIVLKTSELEFRVGSALMRQKRK